MSNYIVVSSTYMKQKAFGEELCLIPFCKKCNEMIDEGYHPIGGLQFHYSQVHQAFVKYEAPDHVGMASSILEHIQQHPNVESVRQISAEEVKEFAEKFGGAEAGEPIIDSKSWLDDEVPSKKHKRGKR